MYLVDEITKVKEDREVLDKKWDKFVAEAKKLKPNFKSPVIPYKDDHMVGKHNGLDNANARLLDWESWSIAFSTIILIKKGIKFWIFALKIRAEHILNEIWMEI